VANEAAGAVSVIDTGDGTVTTLTVGSLPQAVAISPDGAFAYVTNQGSGTVSVIDTATNEVLAPIEVGRQSNSLPEGIATSPDGSHLYVTYGYRPGTDVGPGEVAVIGAASRQVEKRIAVGEEPAGIAVTPDGTKAYVADYGSGQITEISGLAGADPRAEAPIDVGGTPSGVAVSPDGDVVYVTNGNSDEISVLDAASGQLTKTLRDPGFEAPQGIATSPAGDGVYVAEFDGAELGALGPGGELLGTVGVAGSPFGVVYSPDGKTVYASSASPEPAGPGSVSAIDAATRTAIGEPIEVDVDPLGLAITPSQAPEAALSAIVRSAGNLTEFDASASDADYGTIVSYAWDFGDGAGETTTDPQVEHRYAKAGFYRASVTVTDSTGTSTERVFTGQTVSRNGGPSATATRSVTVVEPRPLASPSPTALDFGSQTISQLYLSKPLTLTDSGDAPLQVSSVSIDGGGAGNFAVADDHCSGQTLAPGASCVVEVRFLPTSTGTRAATLEFADNAAGSPHSVPLGGVGQSPTIAVSPPRLDFPDQAPGTDSEPRTLTVANEGSAPLRVDDVAAAGKNAGEFDVVGETCTAALVEPGQSCAIEVEFRPGSFGPRNALVQIEDDAPGSPHVAAVTGSGVGSRASISPPRLSFAAQPSGTRSPARSASVTNTGNAPLHVLRTLLEGTGAGAFAIGDDGCSGQTVAPGASCTIAVAFAAAAPGEYTARLSLDDDAAGARSSVTLEGSVTAPAGGGGPSGGGSAGGGRTQDAHGAGAAGRRPSLRIRPARRVSATRARLVGRVDPNGAMTRYRFQWGPTRRYGRRSAWQRIGGRAAARTVALVIRRLRPRATYHYRLIATNRFGTVRSRDRTFRTRDR
jgi:YVTN family beta-propeller protein